MTSGAPLSEDGATADVKITTNFGNQCSVLRLSSVRYQERRNSGLHPTDLSHRIWSYWLLLEFLPSFPASNVTTF
jgi:hypothetical protein